MSVAVYDPGMAFTGFPIEAIEFFERLEDDNTKVFWTEHKPVYDEFVRAPMQALLDDLAKKYGPSKIFRPHRDVRFSKDKTPYKTNIAAWFESGGYVGLSADNFSTGNGYYSMAKDQLEKFRAAIDDDKTGKALERAIAKVTAADIEVTSFDALKTAPRGYPKDHPRIELLRMKGCIAKREWDIGVWLDSPEPKERVVATIEAAKPLMKWLDTHVGPTTIVRER